MYNSTDEELTKLKDKIIVALGLSQNEVGDLAKALHNQFKILVELRMSKENVIQVLSEFETDNQVSKLKFLNY